VTDGNVSANVVRNYCCRGADRRVKSLIELAERISGFCRVSRPLSPRRHTHTHARAHTHTFVRDYSGKPVPDRNNQSGFLLKQETVSGSGISWAICKSAPRSRQTTTPAPHHSVFLQTGCPSCRPTNSVKALKATALRATLSPPSASIMPCEELRRDYAAWMPSTAPPRSHAGVLMNDDAQLTVPTQTANAIRSAVKRRSVDVLCCRFHGRLKVIAVFTSRHLTTGTKMPISHIC